MKFYLWLAALVMIFYVAPLYWLASNHPEYWWQQPAEAGPQPEPLPGLVHVYEGSFDHLELWQAEMNRLKDAGYTTRACSGGINGRMCVMELQ